MREGRVTMTTEKASDGFYQLAGRRINWDLTDYHPLLGQRQDSPFADPADLDGDDARRSATRSVTDIREGADGNFLIILSDTRRPSGAPMSLGGAGALAIFNRSIGPFEHGRADPGYLAIGRAIARQRAAELPRARSRCPTGTIMVVVARRTRRGNFDIVDGQPARPDARTQLCSPAGGQIRVDAQLAYKYPARALYDNRRQLVFGGSARHRQPRRARSSTCPTRRCCSRC